ncbi:MAG: tripartite tricarboxylate transporter TctB family protein [Pararhodobacter sp.]|nr:tripartite tricarboxylate transporter TctB family protein [Pararhodobacter sp.]
MSEARLNPRAVAGGLLATALGVFAMWEGSGYAIGSIRRMGPGWFPLALGVLLVALGLALALWGLTRHAARAEPGPESESADWRALAAITAGLAAFAALIERAGLVPAVFALVALASLAAGPPRPLRVLALAAAISALSWAVFRLGLGLPLPAFAFWR